MAYFDDVTQLIGNTPLVRINRLIDGDARRSCWPSSSSTTRRARSRTASASRSSTPRRRPGSSSRAAPSSRRTSGNTGIALAMVGAARGYKVVLTMPETMSKERRALLRAFGAELVLTPGPEGMKGAVSQAEEIAAETPGRRPGPPVRQRGQPRRSTAAPPPRRSGPTPTARSTSSSPASAPAAPSPVSARCSRSASRSVQIVAVEPAESPILNGGAARPAQDPGHRRELRPRDPRHGGLRRGHRRRTPRRPSTGPDGPPREEGLLVGHLVRGRAGRRRRRSRPAPENAGQDDRRDHPVASASATCPRCSTTTSWTD